MEQIGQCNYQRSRRTNGPVRPIRVQVGWRGQPCKRAAWLGVSELKCGKEGTWEEECQNWKSGPNVEKRPSMRRGIGCWWSWEIGYIRRRQVEKNMYMEQGQWESGPSQSEKGVTIEKKKKLQWTRATALQLEALSIIVNSQSST